MQNRELTKILEEQGIEFETITIPERDSTDIDNFISRLDEAYRLTKENSNLQFYD